jgi:thiamine-monophosphate kinase
MTLRTSSPIGRIRPAADRRGLSCDELGEEKLLAQILLRLPLSNRVVVAAGDDCAAVKFCRSRELLVLKSDCVVEGVHFTSASPAAAVGWKAMMRALSDFAAMAAVPEFALITLVISGKKKAKWVRDFYHGLSRAARHFDVAVVGGETSATKGNIVVTVSVAGYVESERWVGRNGGKVNDDLFVTGQLGGSIRGRHLNFVPRIAEARWLARHFNVHAMIDLSDGLGADLPRLARGSKLGFRLDESALPVAGGCTTQQAISDGEDYELLFALSPRQRRKLATRWKRKFPKTPLTRIGKLVSDFGFRISDFPKGYVHFQQRR